MSEGSNTIPISSKTQKKKASPKEVTKNETNNEAGKSFFYRMRKRELSAITVAIIAYAGYSLLVPDVSPVVQIRTGKVVGTTAKSRIGKEYYEFVGIPYASPPVGDLRFEVK
jgi:hypothetical protein